MPAWVDNYSKRARVQCVVESRTDLSCNSPSLPFRPEKSWFQKQNIKSISFYFKKFFGFFLSAYGVIKVKANYVMLCLHLCSWHMSIHINVWNTKQTYFGVQNYLVIFGVYSFLCWYSLGLTRILKPPLPPSPASLPWLRSMYNCVGSRICAFLVVRNMLEYDVTLWHV